MDYCDSPRPVSLNPYFTCTFWWFALRWFKEGGSCIRLSGGTSGSYVSPNWKGPKNHVHSGKDVCCDYGDQRSAKCVELRVCDSQLVRVELQPCYASMTTAELTTEKGVSVWLTVTAK